MNVLLAGAGVAARFGVAPGADHRDAQWDQAITELGRFARGKHQADIRQEQTEGADELDQFAIAQMGQWLEFSGAGPQPRK